MVNDIESVFLNEPNNILIFSWSITIFLILNRPEFLTRFITCDLNYSLIFYKNVLSKTV